MCSYLVQNTTFCASNTLFFHRIGGKRTFAATCADVRCASGSGHGHNVGRRTFADIRMTSSARSVPRFLASSLVACGLGQSKGIVPIIADWVCYDDHDKE